MHHQTTKNNRPQVEKGPKPLYCTSGCDKTVKRTIAGKLMFAMFCPVHLLLHAKSLQARDAGVSVDQLRGPVFGKYRRIEKLPAGATLVMSEQGSNAHKARPLVMCVTRAQEAAGIFYDRSLPFVVNGQAYAPPCRGVWFEVGNEGYAVHAWANAAGVTYRMRQLMRTVNRRAGEGVELIPESTIKKLSSKSHRIAMATLMLRNGVPASEIVALGEWGSEEMMRRYVEAIEPFAADARNTTDVIFGEAGITQQQAARVTQSSAVTQEFMVAAVLEAFRRVTPQPGVTDALLRQAAAGMAEEASTAAAKN